MPRPTASGRRLDQDRIADLVSDTACVGVVGDGSVGTGYNRNAQTNCRTLRLDLVAHQPNMLGTWSDERDTVG